MKPKTLHQHEAEHAKLLKRLCTPGTTPPELDRITDAVLAYKPKPKTKAAKRRKRKRNRDAKKV